MSKTVKLLLILVLTLQLGSAALSQVAAPNIEVEKNQSTVNPSVEVKSGMFTSDDTEIYYEIYGAEKSGTPLIVLHGGPGFDHQYFLSNSAFTDLAKTRPVVFYDQRGTGKSAKLTKGQTSNIRNQLEDLLQLTKYLGYEKIDLAGHSWGGFLAMVYAIAFPDNISHLVIIDSMPQVSDDYDNYEKFASIYPKEYEEMNQSRMQALLRHDEQALRASVVAYMKMLFYSPQNRDRFIAGSGNYTYDADVNSSVNESIEGLDLTDKLKELSMPTLILHGRHDANIRFESAELIHQTIPKSELIIFEQSGHMPFYEEKEKFVAAVEKFLDK